jgi:hypothetical protein
VLQHIDRDPIIAHVEKATKYPFEHTFRSSHHLLVRAWVPARACAINGALPLAVCLLADALWGAARR